MPHLKWVDLWALAATLCRENQTLVKAAYFSAYATWLPDKYARHRKYVAALKHYGVECHTARFSVQTAHCKKCSATWKQHEEKETDVHFSLTLLEDAFDDVGASVQGSQESSFLRQLRQGATAWRAKC
jgi:hypothetical protein